MLLISVGYAALTTNLQINGTATVKAQSWSVYFNNVQVKTGSVSGAAIEQYDKLAAGETKTITVKLLFKQDIDPEDLPATAQSGISLSYNTNYVQADGNAVEKNTRLIPTAQSLALAGEIQRWDPVEYNPGTGSISSSTYAGATLNGTINAGSADDWVVLDVTEEGDVLIIPTTYASTTLELEGINGYNNAIYALDEVA